MLWRLGFHSRSHVDVLLEKQDVTLDELLDDDDILQQVKSHNQKLVDFLCRKENVKLLIDYVTIEIEQKDENDTMLTKRILKWPQIACEILCADIEALYDTIVQDEKLMQNLFSFISTSEHSNQTLVLNWIKLISFLYQRKPDEVMKFIQKQENIVKHFVNYVGMGDMHELLLRFMGCEAPVEDFTDANSPFSALTMSFTNQLRLRVFDSTRKERDEKQASANELAKWWLKQDVLKLLIDKLDAKNEVEVHINVTYILAEIINRSTKPGMKVQEDQLNPLAESLLSKEIVNYYITKLLENAKSTVLLEGIALLSVIINTCFNLKILRKSTEIPPAVSVIVSRLKEFVKLLENPMKLDPIETSFGTLDPPLGETRLRIVEFLIQLFKIRYPFVEDELLKCNVLGVIMDLVFKYEFHNLLHNNFLSLTNIILSGESVAAKKALLKDCKLLERILQGFELNEKAIKQKKGMRKGYMGHLIMISNNIVSCSKTQTVVAQITQECKGWEEFVKTELLQRNIIESKQLGGPVPSLHRRDDDMDRQLQEYDDDGEDDFDEDQYGTGDDDSDSDSDEEDETIVINRKPTTSEEKDDDSSSSGSSDSDSDDSDSPTNSPRREEHKANGSQDDEVVIEEPSENDETPDIPPPPSSLPDEVKEENKEETNKSKEETNKSSSVEEEKKSVEEQKPVEENDLGKKTVEKAQFNDFNFWKISYFVNVDDLLEE